MKTVVYPGTFDPPTNGHIDVIRRACAMFDNVIVGVSVSLDKHPMFSLQTRVQMLSLATAGIKNAHVKSFDGLLVDFVRAQNSSVVIRGLRAVSDFEFELQMGYTNASMYEDLDTVYLMPSLKYAFISSSVVRSILKHGGDASHLVPKEIYQCM